MKKVDEKSMRARRGAQPATLSKLLSTCVRSDCSHASLPCRRDKQDQHQGNEVT